MVAVRPETESSYARADHDPSACRTARTWHRAGRQTPGLGSLLAHTSAHALDYLARCDVGIAAIDATVTLTLAPHDLDLP